MAIETITEHAASDPERGGSTLQAQAEAAQEAQSDTVLQAHATATIERLLQARYPSSSPAEHAGRLRIAHNAASPTWQRPRAGPPVRPPSTSKSR
jgi:hypothetical protein